MLEYANARGSRPSFDPSKVDRSRPVRADSKARKITNALDGIGGLGWSVMGFIAGAVFWHFVGFWGFVSSVVFADSEIVASSRLASASISTERPFVVAAADVAQCSAVIKDKQTGVVSVRTCEAPYAPLAQDAYQGRQDRMDVGDQDATDAVRSFDGGPVRGQP